MKDIKIKDTVFFPEPQPMYRELPISKVLGAEAQEYMKAWEFNGLLVFASVAEYDDGREWLHISFSRKNRIETYGGFYWVCGQCNCKVEKTGV